MSYDTTVLLSAPATAPEAARICLVAITKHGAALAAQLARDLPDAHVCTSAKFVAAFVTGSSAILAEGIHSLVDASNEVLLIYGRRRAKLPPDEQFPFGHGKEIYFWSFVVSILIFAGIISGLPQFTAGRLYSGVESVAPIVALGVAVFLLIAYIVFFQEAQRKIPVQYSRSVFRSGRMYRQSGQTHIPLRVNTTGMIPLIFINGAYTTHLQPDWGYAPPGQLPPWFFA